MKSNLPIEVHDHFRKANILHTYVLKDLAEASTHALETGQELLAAKKTIPHGSWEDECQRLFDGSPRTARFYMTFAKDMAALPNRQNFAILMLEGSLTGAAKAARDAAKPSPPPDAPESPPDAQEPETTSGSPGPPKGHQQATGKPDRGKCPVCAGTKWQEDEDGVSCAKCHHPWGEATGGPDDDRITTQKAKARKTTEALMRAIDDLQCMKARPLHDEAIKACKGLLTIIKRW